MAKSLNRVKDGNKVVTQYATNIFEKVSKNQDGFIITNPSNSIKLEMIFNDKFFNEIKLLVKKGVTEIEVTEKQIYLRTLHYHYNNDFMDNIEFDYEDNTNPETYNNADLYYKRSNEAIAYAAEHFHKNYDESLFTTNLKSGNDVKIKFILKSIDDFKIEDKILIQVINKKKNGKSTLYLHKFNKQNLREFKKTVKG